MTECEAACTLAATDNFGGRDLIDTIRARIALLEAEEFLELAQLPLETHVGKDHGTALARELESLLKLHVFLLHKVGNDTASTPTHTSIAMHQHPTLGHALFYK